MKLSVEAAQAVTKLQYSVLNSVDLKAQERDERAIDEILRHPEKTLPEQYQRKNAVRHAKWHTARAGAKTSFTSLDDPGQFESTIEDTVAIEDPGFGIGDILHWLSTSESISGKDRALLLALADGYDAELLALMYDIDIKRMRERISRARSRGWAAYQSEAAA